MLLVRLAVIARRTPPATVLTRYQIQTDSRLTSPRTVSGDKYIFASFHGDTDGLATPPVLRAVHAVATMRPSHTLVFGLDANGAWRW